MKKVLTIAALFIGLMATAQNAVKGKDGNYIAVSHRIAKDSAKATGNTYTDVKGNVYPVMVSATGKLFVIRTSGKTGKEYKMYLKVN